MGNEVGKESLHGKHGASASFKQHDTSRRNKKKNKKNKKTKKSYMRRGVGFIYKQVTGESLSKANFGSAAFGSLAGAKEAEGVQEAAGTSAGAAAAAAAAAATTTTSSALSPRSGTKRRLSVSALDREATFRENSGRGKRALLSPKRSRSAKVRCVYGLHDMIALACSTTRTMTTTTTTKKKKKKKRKR